MSRLRGQVLLLLWVLALTAVIACFHSVGRGPLTTPPLLQPDAWPAWTSGREPIHAVLALLRVALLAAAWYLLVVTALGAAARSLHVARLVAVTDVVTVPMVRRLLHATVGLSLATTSLTTLGPAMLSPAPAAALVAEHEDPIEDRAIMRRIDGPGHQRAWTPPLPAHDPAVLSPGHRVPQPTTTSQDRRVVAEGGPQRWRVRSGQHLWGIAEQVLTSAWGRAPSDREITPYWRRLIQTNQAVLPDPANPDLIYPGQLFELPNPPPTP